VTHKNKLWNSCNKQWRSYRPVYSFGV